MYLKNEIETICNKIFKKYEECIDVPGLSKSFRGLGTKLLYLGTKLRSEKLRA